MRVVTIKNTEYVLPSLPMTVVTIKDTEYVLLYTCEW